MIATLTSEIDLRWRRSYENFRIFILEIVKKLRVYSFGNIKKSLGILENSKKHIETLFIINLKKHETFLLHCQRPIKFAIFSLFIIAASKNTNIEFVESALILQTQIPAIFSLRDLTTTPKSANYLNAPEFLGTKY